MKITTTDQFHQLYHSIHTTVERKWQFEIIGIDDSYNVVADRFFIGELLTVDAAREKAEKRFLQEYEGYRIREIIYIDY